MTHYARHFGLCALLALVSAPAASQDVAARPGYLARALVGGVPIGALRGAIPGADQPVLFVVNRPTRDSTAFSAFVDGRLVRRLALPVSEARARLLDVDIPAPLEGMPEAERPFVAFAFDGPDISFDVLWDHEAGRWVLVGRYDADGSAFVAGDAAWFGADFVAAWSPASWPDAAAPASDRDARRLPLSAATSLGAERAVVDGTATYRLDVRDGGTSPVQSFEGAVFGYEPDLAEDGPQSCTGLPAVRDVNGDGHADFWLCESEGENGSQRGAYRVFDPAAGLFVEDLAFAFRGRHTFDPAARTIEEGLVTDGGAYQTYRTYDVSSGVPVLVHERTREPEEPSCTEGPSCRSVFTTRALESGEMRVTESRRGRADEFLPEGFGQTAD